MENSNDLQKRYLEQLEKERIDTLIESSSIISSFVDYCNCRQIPLMQDNFNYIPAIGVVAEYPNIVHLLNPNVVQDKEGLVNIGTLEKEYTKWEFSGGYHSDKYMILAHPYFRRGYSSAANFAPRFIDVFWNYEKTDSQKYIAIDRNRVRINIDDTALLEFDTWYGAQFKKTISDIDDGIVKLRPPLELNPFIVRFLFGDTYSLDIKWTTKDGIKTFQAEEFQEDGSRLQRNGTEYHPAKYLHAEFDMNQGFFKHLDGAIHFYSQEEYYQRRESDFNYNNKNTKHLKTPSRKLFKINGQLPIDEWIEFVSQFLTGNPLVAEYFEGKLPDRVSEMLEPLKTFRQNNSGN